MTSLLLSRHKLDATARRTRHTGFRSSRTVPQQAGQTKADSYEEIA